MPTFLIGAYWGPRAAQAADCAEKLTDWAAFLAASGLPGVEAWLLRRPRGTEAFTAGRLVAPPEKLLRPMKHEISGEVLPEFGFSLGMYSARGGSLASEMSAQLGSTVPGVSNSMVLTLRTASEPAREVLVGLLDKAVSLFAPEHAVVLDWERPDPQDARPVWQRPSLAAYSATSAV